MMRRQMPAAPPLPSARVGSAFPPPPAAPIRFPCRGKVFAWQPPPAPSPPLPAL